MSIVNSLSPTATGPLLLRMRRHRTAVIAVSHVILGVVCSSMLGIQRILIKHAWCTRVECPVCVIAAWVRLGVVERPRRILEKRDTKSHRPFRSGRKFHIQSLLLRQRRHKMAFPDRHCTRRCRRSGPLKELPRCSEPDKRVNDKTGQVLS